MKRKPIIAAGVLTLAASIALGIVLLPLTTPRAFAQAAATQTVSQQTATFVVENMTCPLCPVTVKKAMEGVEGVRSVKIDFATKKATVVFDPSATNIEAISAASTNAGYPASVAQQGS